MSESGTCEKCGHISTHSGMDCIYSTPVGCLCPDCMYDSICSAFENIRKYWRFDNSQQHTHSWHDREEFIRRWEDGTL